MYHASKLSVETLSQQTCVKRPPNSVWNALDIAIEGRSEFLQFISGFLGTITDIENTRPKISLSLSHTRQQTLSSSSNSR